MVNEYTVPRDEERVFMFLDLKSSTAIAEEIGHRSYFEFISDFIADATSPILDNHGEIYQYVGDEIVISWHMSGGQIDTRCIQCFFDIREKIERSASRYKAKYNLVPQFKAGLHCGKVTVGRIGVVKQDVIYSGDAINTTAHIRTKCSEYHTDLLISSYLAEKLSTTGYEIKPLGSFKLKGKQLPVQLNSVELSKGKNAAQIRSWKEQAV